MKMCEEDAGQVLGPDAGSVDSIESASAGIEQEQGGRSLDQGGGAGACGSEFRAAGADEMNLDLGLQRSE
jgi:hypothetical protein